MTGPRPEPRILITRALPQAAPFRALLESRGARVVELPTIEIRPCDSPQLSEALASLPEYDWLIFTSANAVDIFFQQWGRRSGQDSLPSSLHIACIGPATSRQVELQGERVDLEPDYYQAEGLIASFQELGPLEGLRMLLPRARKARRVLPDQLRKMGARVDVVAVYETVIPALPAKRLREALVENPPDLVAFTSPSTVENFVRLCRTYADPTRFPCAVIGPITAAAARRHHLQIVIESPHSSIPDLAQAIGDYLSRLL